MKKAILALAAAALVMPAAQAQMGPAKHPAADYYVVTMIDFEEGRAEAAHDLIHNYFAKADEVTGGTGPDVVMNFITGEWDMMVAWKMKGGMADAEWAMSPDDARWFGGLVQVAGGEAQAMAKWEEWVSMIARTSTHYAFSPDFSAP
ncbi:MAG: hypothetical protein ACFBQW_01745 [Sphingomonadaceae bacterium]